MQTAKYLLNLAEIPNFRDAKIVLSFFTFFHFLLSLSKNQKNIMISSSMILAVEGKTLPEGMIPKRNDN